jgi:hypothetical protein
MNVPSRDRAVKIPFSISLNRMFDPPLTFPDIARIWRLLPKNCKYAYRIVEILKVQLSATGTRYSVAFNGGDSRNIIQFIDEQPARTAHQRGRRKPKLFVCGRYKGSTTA